MGFIYIILIIGLYFIPTINAYSRKHRNASAILALNFFLGWSILGWIISLVWSFTNDVENTANITTTKQTESWKDYFKRNKKMSVIVVIVFFVVILLFILGIAGVMSSS